MAGFIDFPVGEGNLYQHSLSCDYTITVDHDKVVNITFTQFNLESGTSRGCGFDWLAIRDGDTRAPEMGRYCGQELPGDNGTIITTRNIATLEFRSGHSFLHPL